MKEYLKDQGVEGKTNQNDGHSHAYNQFLKLDRMLIFSISNLNWSHNILKIRASPGDGDLSLEA